MKEIEYDIHTMIPSVIFARFGDVFGLGVHFQLK
jgi:hypothetical protein